MGKEGDGEQQQSQQGSQNLTMPDISGVPGVNIPDAAQAFSLSSTARFPLGGLGAAWVERSPNGAFSFRCPLSEGRSGNSSAENTATDNNSAAINSAAIVSGCQFAIFEQVEGEAAKAYALNSQGPDDQSLSQWQWYPADDSGATAGVYHLYPRTWYTYGGVFNSQIVCDQFSPILPNNYQETSYPLSVFEWRFHNPSDRPVTLSVMLSWENLIGSNVGNDEGKPALKFNQPGGNFNRWVEDFFRVGCSLMNTQALGNEGYLTTKEPPPVNQGQWAIVTADNPVVEVFYHTQWRPDGDGNDLWESFASDGSLANENGEAETAIGERLGAAIAVRFTIRPGRSRTIPFILSWDLPTSSVATDAVGLMPYRFADFFGRDGQNAWYMARTALKHCDTWRTNIQQWQQSILDAGKSPGFSPDDAPSAELSQAIKATAINSLSQMAIDLGPWTAADDLHPRGQLWRGDRSTFDNTWALYKLWPDLEQSQIRSILTQEQDAAEAGADWKGSVDITLRLHRIHMQTDVQMTPDFFELADLLLYVAKAFDAFSEPSAAFLELPDFANNNDDLARLNLGLEAAIALTQLLIDNQPHWTLSVDQPAISSETLTEAVARYTALRQKIGDRLTAFTDTAISEDTNSSAE
ncbi:MAG: GH116 family glycosyl-hydrolase [Cyanobacteria bacterium P01_D01_bin.73]